MQRTPWTKESRTSLSCQQSREARAKMHGLSNLVYSCVPSAKRGSDEGLQRCSFPIGWGACLLVRTVRDIFHAYLTVGT